MSQLLLGPAGARALRPPQASTRLLFLRALGQVLEGACLLEDGVAALVLEGVVLDAVELRLVADLDEALEAVGRLLDDQGLGLRQAIQGRAVVVAEAQEFAAIWNPYKKKKRFIMCLSDFFEHYFSH